MNKNFSGLYTALVTPFNEDKSIDYFTLEKLINDQIESRVAGLVILGTTGEGPIIENNEGEEIIKLAVKLAHTKVKIIVGTGGNNTKHSVEKSKKAEDLGADAVLCVNPYYNRPTQNGIYQHFVKIADSINIPVMLYNIKSRTGVNLETSTLLQLSKHNNIIGVKEASGDIFQIMDVIQNVDKDFIILSGDDTLIYPVMCLGGHGVVSVTSNILPKKIKNIISQCEYNNFNAAMESHYKIKNLMTILLSISSNPIPIKTLLGYIGKIKEEFRLPLCNLDNNKRNELIRVYNNYINMCG